jgi:hypothetical protein
VAAVLLGAVLVQVLLFFFGLMVPFNRILLEWNRTVDERRALFAPAGQSIKAIADQLPANARVYLMDPDATTHKNSLYYFYPRLVSITMTDTCYEAIYERWNERPTAGWLETHGYTFVLSYKDRRLTPVGPKETPNAR